MEILNFGDPVDLWKSWDDCGKIHTSYGVCVDPCILFYLWVLGTWGVHHCFTRILFISCQEHSMFSLIPNYGILDQL
jgi:hypothetical protein